MDDYSGEEPGTTVATAIASTIASSLRNATNATNSTDEDIVASGLGWGLGLFAGVVLIVAVGYFVLRRRSSVNL